MSTMTRSFFSRSATAFVSTLSVVLSVSAAPASAQTAVTVVEYYNTKIAAYFLTGRAAEQAALDGVPDFQRTGMTFAATAAASAVAGQDSVCRYRIDLTGSNWAANSSAPFSSHFYGLSTDCALIASYNFTNFYNEGLDFAVTRPTAGACPASAPVAVYRTLRGSSQVDVPNHRYTVSQSAYADMQSQGWSAEGVAFCVTSATQYNPRPQFAAASTVENSCVSPRAGSSPLTGRPYPDRQGTLGDELSWVRAFSDETYLWYREIPNISAAGYASGESYFSPLKSPAVSYSGLAKDKPGFHYSLPTSELESTNAGIVYGYGITWSMIRNTPPRQLLVAVVDPGSPADLAGVKRGDSVLRVDGVDLVNSNTQSGINTLNAGLFPSVLGESHVLVLAPAGGGANKTVTLTSAQLALQAVPVSGIINTTTGKVGYIAFTTFNSFAAEGAIANAITGLRTAGVNDLVLDLRYNGGGYLYIASQLGYMIAGSSRTAGKVFERSKTNDKKPFGPDEDTPFYNDGSGYPGGVAAGQALPTLNLPRVFVLTSGNSCSASEAFINGLRGIDAQVILIGSKATCGKPFGFYGTDNCGTAYFTIQFTGANAKGEGDYVDGFAPTCTVADDLTRALGDPAEGQLAAALAYRTSGSCGPQAKASVAVTPSTVGGLPIGDARMVGRSNKLGTPAGVSRSGGQPITERAPAELGDQQITLP